MYSVGAQLSTAATNARILGLAGLESLDGFLLRTRGSLRGRLAAGNRWSRKIGSGSSSNLLHIDCELDSVYSGLGTQIVHARLQAQLPTMKMHGRQLRGGRVRHVDVERLRLVDIRATVCSHVQHNPLLNFPHG